ncbi:MAG: M48 family metalloprotease [Spirulina sp. SIO3F2]|nr:M48 family metalloprotease [Spirulina sp. SIO3F2]
MLPKFLRLRSRTKPRWLYGLVSFIVMAGIVLGPVAASQAISIFDILRGGAEVLQGIQLEGMSPPKEMEFGAGIDNQIKQQLANNGTPVVNPNHEASIYINNLGERLVAQLTNEERRVHKDKTGQGIQYTFQVVNDPGINAFATMGGFVYINSGLIAFAETESQLTSVIGHEMGHIMERHAIKQVKNEAIRRGVLTAAGLGRDQLLNIGTTVALTLPNSRRAETEADEVGLDVLRRGGYYPEGMPQFMSKLGQQSRGGQPAILSTHPNPNARAQHLRDIIAANPPTATEIDGNDPVAYCNQIKSFFRDAITCPTS